MMPDTKSFADRAAEEIDALHRLLQAWFRAEGESAPGIVLAHFDQAFTMTTPTGKVVTYQQFSGAFPTLRGTRPGLVMEISDVTVRYADGATALVTYVERQRQDAAVTDRLSTALLLNQPGRATPIWRHLHETWQG